MLRKVSGSFANCDIWFLVLSNTLTDNLHAGCKQFIITNERNITMPKRQKRLFILTGSLFLLFILLTIIMKTVDVKPVGPNQSKIGLASINQFLFNHLGANSIWYSITNLLGVIAIFFAVGFAISGLCQFIKGKSISKVDFHLLLLGALYILVIVFYIFFEFVIINYRPVLIDSELEASYPSSHTMITICIMASSMLQFHQLLHNSRKRLLIALDVFSVLIIAVTIIGRLLSGVHWFTDIAAAILLSAALVMLYYSVVKWVEYIHNPE